MNHVIGMGLRGAVSSDEFDCVENFYRVTFATIGCDVVIHQSHDVSATESMSRDVPRKSNIGIEFKFHCVEDAK